MRELDMMSTAIMMGDYVAVKRILEQNDQLANMYNLHGWTPLHLSAHYGHVEISRLLVEYGADIYARAKNEMDDNYWHMTIANQEIDTMKVFLKDEFNIKLKKVNGWTPLHEAVLTGDSEFVKLIAKAYNEQKGKRRYLQFI